LDSRLGAWTGADAVAKQAAANLQNEYGCEVDKLESYLVELAKRAPNLSVATPSLEFEQVGKPFWLAGHEATPIKGAIFGRAMLLEKYARYVSPVLEKLRYTDTAEVIRATLRKLDGVDEAAAPPYLRGYFQAIRETPLGRGAVFAIFAKPVDAGQRPWRAPIPDADAIRSSVALGEDDEGKDYILFAYRLPAGVVPRVPTTASPGWFYQQWFRPNGGAATDLHGWTEPLKPGFDRLPEVVHEEIFGTLIAFPIHIATA
jgi:hypothetical protein